MKKRIRIVIPVLLVVIIAVVVIFPRGDGESSDMDRRGDLGHTRAGPHRRRSGRG